MPPPDNQAAPRDRADEYYAEDTFGGHVTGGRVVRVCVRAARLCVHRRPPSPSSLPFLCPLRVMHPPLNTHTHAPVHTPNNNNNSTPARCSWWGLA
jgi:hypothetical protein